MEESDALRAATNAVKKAGPKTAQKINPIVAASTTGPKIAEKITRLLIPAPCDIAALQSMYESYCFFDDKPVHIDLEHLWAFYERTNIKRSGHMQPPRLHGGHHDYGRRLEKAGKIIDGIRYPAKTYFNPDWSEQKVIEKIFEAFNDTGRSISIDKQGHYKIVGTTSEGLNIQIIFDPYQSKITTAYPLVVQDLLCIT